jgi:hypothetical protein
MGSGRALLLTAYKGMLERGPSPPASLTTQWRDRSIQDVKDLGRSVDYIETRTDIDMSRLGYLGISLGAIRAPLNLVVEPSFRAAVLVSGCTVRQESP